MLNKKYLFVFFLLLSTLQIIGQRDTRFWFALPDVSEGHVHGNPRFELNLRFSSFDVPATVTISIPANDDFEPIVRDIDAYETKTVEVTEYFEDGVIRNVPPGEVLDKGILIEATNFITAYYEKTSYANPDIYSLKGDNALGTEFYVPFQNHWDNWSGQYNPEPYSAIYIVATEDNTTITVTPTNPVHPDRPAGVPFDITLDRGQTYAVAPNDYDGGEGQVAENKLGGTKIKSDNPITVITSDDSIAATLTLPGGGLEHCRDIIGDQLIPANTIGLKYIAMKSKLEIEEYFYVIGTQNDTEVSIDGESEDIIDEGEILSYEFIHQYHYIEASKPVYVYHVGGFGCEMGAAILPPIDICTGSSQISFTRSTSQGFFLNILVREGAEDGFILNGVDNVISEDDFQPVFGNDDWLIAEFEAGVDGFPDLEAGQTNIIENVKDVFHLATINGGSKTGTMYGYFSDFNELELIAYERSQLTDRPYGCRGDEYILVAEGGTNYEWTPTEYLDNPNTASPVATPPEGTTEFEVQVSGYCGMEGSASVTTTAVPPPDADFSINDNKEQVAPGKTFTIENFSSGGNIYEWDFDDGNESYEFEPVYSYNEPGQYDITLKVSIDTIQHCYDEITKEILAGEACKIVFPNAIKPEASPEKDIHVFLPYYENIVDYDLRIYNRWGKLIFRTTDESVGWDGYHRGKLVSGDVYVWKIKATCTDGTTIEETGDITLIR